MTKTAVLCACGCGKITPIATESRPHRGWIKGQHTKYYPHHSKRLRPDLGEDMKRCRKCLEVKSVDDFWVNRNTWDKLQAYCKPCAKRANYGWRERDGSHVRVVMARFGSQLKKYKITQADYDAMLLEQDGLCAICQRPETETRKGTLKRLAIDHCHVTGRVRGLLCSSCNHAIGKLKDDPALVRRALEYLERR